MLIRPLLAAAIAVLSVASVRAEAITYLGELAGKPIVVELSSDPANGGDARLVGRYAYLPIGIDIPLHAVSAQGGKVVLHEEQVCTDELCGDVPAGSTVPDALKGPVWTLTLSENGTELSGSWQVEPGAESLPVRFGFIGARPFDAAEPSPAALAALSPEIAAGELLIDVETTPYEVFKLSGIDPVTESEVSFGQTEVRYLIDPRTRFRFPQISALDGADPVPGNTWLLNRRSLMSLAALACESARSYFSLGWMPGISADLLGGYPDEQVEVTYLSRTLISWTESGSLFCGGAHPYNHAESYSLDLATGRPLDLGRIFAGWTSDDYGQHPPQALIDLVIARRSTLSDPDFDRDCAIADLIPDHLGLRFDRDERVTFTLEGLPHALVACGEDLLSLPLAQLRPFLAPEAASYFPSLGQTL